SALDLAAHYRDLSEQLRKMVLERVDDEYGLDIPQLFIVDVSLPEEVEKALDTRSSMGVIGDMGRFQQFQMGKAMTAAAENPAGGGAAEGMGLGMGFAMANRMAQATQAPSAGAAPPPIPQDNVWHLAVNGQGQGPYDTRQLLAGIRAGRIPPATLVWSPALVNWTPAAQVGPLANAFRTSPPPPPPAQPGPGEVLFDRKYS